MRQLSTKVHKKSQVKGSIQSKRKHCCLAPTFRTEATQHIFHGFERKPCPHQEWSFYAFDSALGSP
jgi:hypothetical protein